MRIYLKLSKNTEVIPFNYQQLLTGVIHKWIGRDNEIHGKSSYFNFSWLQNTTAVKGGLNLKQDAYFFISAYDVDFIKRITKGILEDPNMFNGVRVYDVQLMEVPLFETGQSFIMASPVLLKNIENSQTKYITYLDNDFEELLTERFKGKLEKAGISSAGFSVKLDPESTYRSTKMIKYKHINNKTTLAPVVIEGNQEQISYAWCVGLGQSTGIGFGALK